MSETYKEREVRCYFGILNIKGLMDTDNKVVGDIEDYGEVRLPLFSHQTYKIKTTFNKNLQYSDTLVQTVNEQGFQVLTPKKTTHYGNLHFADSSNSYQGKYYQKKFRRQVLWDFGDGTKIQGYSAEHSYKKPGRYKITCTFFDINRQAWVNNYCIYVVVKEVIPTELRFVTDKTVSQIKCSKIQKITQVEALLSNTINKDLEVNVKRIFTEEQYKNQNIQISHKFDMLPSVPFRFMDRSWLFLQNTEVLYYNSDKVYMNSIKPSDVFHPQYQDLYGRFFYNEITKDIDFSFYQVIPFKNIDDKLKTIRMIDPNSRIISQKDGEISESWKEYTITQVYVMDALPEGCVYVGKRGFFDIFYKNDFVSNYENVISIFYDIETENITGELQSAPNYLNINPLGLNVQITHNEINSVKLGISLDGFLRQVQQDDDFINPRVQNTYIDPHLYNSLIKNTDMDVYVFPYIPYESELRIQVGDQVFVQGESNGFTPYNDAYYVPKDVILRIKDSRTLHSGRGNSSFINTGIQISENGDIIDFGQGNVMQSVYNWLYRIPIILRDYIDISFIITVLINGQSLDYKPAIKRLQLLDTSKIEIPKEIQYKEDINRLLDVYMGHPMFAETQNLRDMFKAFLGNNLLNYIMTKSKNFLDDTANVKTCYLSNLISTLKMLGEDVTEYEKSAFQGINDLKNFVRLLSINHADLVGHVIIDDLDINIKGDTKGKNVGSDISINDTLYLNNSENSQFLGRIIGLKRHGSSTRSKLLLESNDLTKNGLELIIHDRYTNQTRIVSFMTMQKTRILNNKEILSDVTIGDYEESWGWNLLLPDRFVTAKKKQNEYAAIMASESYYNYSTSRRQFIASEYERMKQICREMVDGYYSFHLLDPRRQTKRVGNFIDDEYITERIQNLKSWQEVWGITHEILMKILYENAKLHNNRTFNIIQNDAEEEEKEEQTYITTGQIYLSRQFDEAEVIYDLYVNGKHQNDVKVSGSVVAEGTILGQGRNNLVISVENGLVDRYFSFSNYEAPRFLEIQVNHDGTISENSETFYLIGDNVQGSIKVIISGSVEKPSMKVEAEIYFIDRRIEPVTFIVNKFLKERYYTNKKREELDSGAIIDGLVDCTDLVTRNKKFDVSIRWQKTPQIGYNRAYISINYNMGDLYYKKANAVSENIADWGNDVHVSSNPYSVHEYPCDIIVQNDGTIHFANEMLVFDVSTQGDAIDPVNGASMYQKGKIYISIQGNTMSDTKPSLNCYTYNPKNQKQDVITRVLIDVGGYSFKITDANENCQFLVNGENGFEQGYYFIINSRGHNAHSPFLYRKYSIIETIYVFDSQGNMVTSASSPQRVIHISATDKAVISQEGQEGFVNYYKDSSISGNVYVETYGGYYSLGGYSISVSK